DAVGGLDDFAARRVRFIGEASERIREDYLRILRFFRFYAWYGAVEGGIDEDGLAACADLAEGLESLSAERIGAEMRKLLSAPDPGPAVASMSQSGVLHRIMPGAEASTLPILIHFENAIAPDWTRRALMIGGEDIAERWRLTKMEARNIALMRSALEQDTSVLELAYRHDVELARNVALVRSASLQQPTTVDLEKQLSEASKASFPVKSADLMPAFEGAALGKELKRLEARWIASNFTMSKSELLAQ
ncbi:MAG: CCA tRNA nucleotidyltransferase, partial [Litoreibacter sp.]|nr:CCA tRNA nucleotidyltransferase [Litoreibacter sp.]